MFFIHFFFFHRLFPPHSPALLSLKIVHPTTAWWSFCIKKDGSSIKKKTCFSSVVLCLKKKFQKTSSLIVLTRTANRMLIRRFDQALFFSRMSDMICAIYKAATTAAKGKEKSIPKMFELMYSTTKWHHQHQRACLCLSHYIFCCVSIQRDTAREEETRWYYCEMIFLASSFNQTQTIFFLLAFLFLLASLAVSSRRHYTRALSQLRIIILSCKKKAQSRVKLPSNPTDNKNNCTQHRGMKSSIFFSFITIHVRSSKTASRWGDRQQRQHVFVKIILRKKER